MSIQFACASCRQPIEVDDELANQAVTCPYCRNVVTAPATSLAAPPAPPPPASGVGLPSAAPRPVEYGVPPLPKPNKAASFSLICAVICLLSTCVVMVPGLGATMTAIRKVAPDGNMQGREKDLNEAMTKAMQEFLSKPWIRVHGFVVLFFAVAGVILGILGLTRGEGRRWQAVSGLTVCGLFLACQCLGMIGSLMPGAAVGPGA